MRRWEAAWMCGAHRWPSECPMARFASWSANVSLSSCRCSPTYGHIWCSAMTGRTFPAPTTTWNAAFVDSKRAIAASVAARTGMPNGSRYGRSVVYYEWWEQDATRRQQLVAQASRLDRTRLSRTASPDHRRPARATHALSLPSPAPGFARFPPGALGCRCSSAFFALTEKKHCTVWNRGAACDDYACPSRPSRSLDSALV